MDPLHTRSSSGLALLAACAGAFALSAGGHARTVDEQVLMAQSESLLHGSIAIPQTIDRGHFYGRIGADGQPYSAYSPAWSALALPFYALGQVLADRWQLDETATRAVAEVTSSWLNALAAAIVVALLWLLLVDAGYHQGRVALPIALAAGITTPLWVYAGSLYTEPVSAAALTGAVWASMRWTRNRHASALAIAGACLAVLPLVKLGHVVLVPVVVLAVVLQGSERGERAQVITWLVLPALIAVGAHLAFNGWLFGSPFTSGYPETWNGKPLSPFHTPFWVGLFGFLLSPGKGIAVFAPLALVGAAFVGLMARRHDLSALLAVAPLAALIVFFMTYSQWEGGYCFGPRYLVPALPLSLIPLAELLQQLVESGRRGLQVAFVVLVLASGWVQLGGVTTNWFATPRDHDLYYNESFDYRLTYSPVLELSRRVGRGLAQLPRERLTRARLLNHWYVHLGDAGVPFSLRVTLGGVGMGGLAIGLGLGWRALVMGRRTS